MSSSAAIRKPIGKKERTKQAMLAAATDMISEHGVHFLTVRRLTEFLEISNGSFYYHFENIEDLLELLGHEIARRFTDFESTLVPTDPAEALAWAPLYFHHYLDNNPESLSMLLHVVEDPYQKHAEFNDRIRVRLDDAIRSDRFSLEDPDLAVRFCRGLLASSIRYRREKHNMTQIGAATATHMLAMLGLPLDEAKRLVAKEKRRLRRRFGGVL